MDRPARAIGRARSRLSGGRSEARGDGDRRADRSRRRPGAAVRTAEGQHDPAAHQSVRHGTPDVPRVRRRVTRRRRRQAVGDPRAAAAGRTRRQGARAEDAEVDRRLATEGRQARRLPGDRPPGRRGRSRPAAGADLLAGRRRAVHHAARRAHARSAHRPAQRGYVSHAGARAALDRDALADPQGRPSRLPLHRGPDGGRRRARSRSRSPPIPRARPFRSTSTS